jgi:mevalonyl-CoA ligase
MLLTTERIGRHDNRPLLAELARKPGKVREVVILRGDTEAFSRYESLIEDGLAVTDEVFSSTVGQFDSHDVCNLQFTSGTTGHPKAAMLTH